jgi:hypothetical protein
MSPDEFHALSEAKQKEVQEAIAALEQELAKAIHEVPRMRREAQRKVRELNRQVIGATVTGLIEELKAAWAALEPVVAFLESVHQDVSTTPVLPPRQGRRTADLRHSGSGRSQSPLGRYQVNVIIEHRPTAAPHRLRGQPSHDNLVAASSTSRRWARCHQSSSRQGPCTAPTALPIPRCAQGVTQPFAWEALARDAPAQIRIESPRC